MEHKIVIAAYRSKPGMESRLAGHIAEKRKFMTEAGYYTSRPAIVMRSEKDESLIIEIIEWESLEAIERAHKDDRVHSIWAGFDELCKEVGCRLDSFPEAGISFPHFAPVTAGEILN